MLQPPCPPEDPVHCSRGPLGGNILPVATAFIPVVGPALSLALSAYQAKQAIDAAKEYERAVKQTQRGLYREAGEPIPLKLQTKRARRQAALEAAAPAPSATSRPPAPAAGLGLLGGSLALLWMLA